MNQGLGLVRKKGKGDWTEKHRNVDRKIFLEGGWTQKKIVRYWMVGQQSVSRLSEGGKAQARQLSGIARSEARYSGSFQEMRAKDDSIKGRREMAEHPLSGSQWNRGNFRMKMWESEKHQSWSVQVEGFRSHLATDGSLLGQTGVGSLWLGRGAA